MPEAERENIFYVSATSAKGFTSDPAHAIQDLTGAPVIAPGHLIRLTKSLADRHAKSLKRVWDALLDSMEEEIVAVAAEDSEVATMHRAQGYGLITALAILEYGHEYKTDPEAAIQRIIDTAVVKYEQETE